MGISFLQEKKKKNTLILAPNITCLSSILHFTWKCIHLVIISLLLSIAFESLLTDVDPFACPFPPVAAMTGDLNQHYCKSQVLPFNFLHVTPHLWSDKYAVKQNSSLFSTSQYG